MSEFINLEKDGSSTVRADLLIKNHSEEPIEYIRIIYPNRFYSIPNNIPDIDTSKINFSDITPSFRDKKDPINWSFELPGSSVEIISKETDSSIPDWAYGRKLQQFNFSGPGGNNDISFYGLFDENGELSIGDESFNRAHLIVLWKLNYTIFTYQFNNPLGKEKRWLRLKFSGQDTAQNLDYTHRTFLRKITNTLQYQYQVSGPNDVKANFIKYLSAFKWVCENKYQCSPGVVEGFINLFSLFEEEGLIPTSTYLQSSTVYERMFLCIDPGDFEQLIDVNSEGSLIKYTEFPNIRQTANFYQWKVINQERENFLFSLWFHTRPFLMVHSLMPYIAALLAIIGIALKLFVQ